MKYRTLRRLMAIAGITFCLTSGVFADILVDGEPNIDDNRLWAWYDGNEGLGFDGIAETPVWPNKQGDELLDITSGWGPGNPILQPVPTLNGHSALRYVDVVSWADGGNWGTLSDQMTIFVAATVRDANYAYFFTGNQGGGGTEANAGYGGADPGFWSMRASDDWVQTAAVVEDELQYHAFTFNDDGVGRHHLNGELVGEGEVGIPELQGFVLGGRQNGFERASVDFAEVLIYDEALSDTDRQAVESYLENKFFGATGIPGDYDGNGQLDATDLDWQAEVALGQRPFEEKYDENGDDVVNGLDREIWLNDRKKTWVGDSNFDFEFNTADFVQVFTAGKYETTERAGWIQGDWTGDLIFDTADFVAAFSADAYERGPFPGDQGVAAVPEPNALVLLVLGIVTLSLRRRLAS